MIRISKRDTENLINITKEDIKIGMTLYFYGSSPSEFDGTELRVLNNDRTDDRINTEVIKTNDSNEHENGKHICPMIQYLFMKNKPHEFSPVNMTGRYRTIGD